VISVGVVDAGVYVGIVVGTVVIGDVDWGCGICVGYVFGVVDVCVCVCWVCCCCCC